MPLRGVEASTRSCMRASLSVPCFTTRYLGPCPVPFVSSTPFFVDHSELCIHSQPFGGVYAKLLSVMTATVPNCPNACSALIDGGVPTHEVCGTCPVALCLERLYLNIASRSASSHYSGGRLPCHSAALAALTNVPFRRSAMPFSCGWYV